MDIGTKKNYKDATGSFELANKADGLYLTVFAVSTGNNNIINKIINVLQEMQALNIDNSAIESLACAPGTSMKVAEAKPVIIITVGLGDMEAAAYVNYNSIPDRLSREDVRAALNQKGIVFGIDEKAMQNVVSQPGTVFRVACGDAPKDGKDAYIVIRTKISDEKGKPKEIAGGRVDYKHLDLFTTVFENDIIAEKIPPTKGENGSTITGKPLKAKDGKDKRITTGKNINIENNIYTAKVSGHLVMSRDRIDVLPVLELKADIDFSTGNIDFPGNVVVKGSVQAGFTVKAGGNIQIQGSIFGGTVEGKSIEVKHGIQGVNNSCVKAHETLIAKFVENAEIYAGEQISIADAILHSKVSAGGKVIAMGGKGIIAGGHVSAGEEVEAKTIGTQMAPPTIIEVGVNPMLKEEYLVLRNEYRNKIEMLDSTRKSMILLKPTETSVLPPARVELYAKLETTQIVLAQRVEYLKERILEIESDFEKLKHGKVKCSGIIYPGVKLLINNIVYPVRDNIQFATFYVEDNEVKFAAYF